MALEKGDYINGMKVSFILKDKDGTVTYRVRDAAGILKVLKHGVTNNERKYSPLSFLYADAGEDYVLYRHVNGETLERRLHRMLRLEDEEATQLTLDILNQLAAFHKQGVTYGNLSPDNTLIEVHGQRPIAYLCGMSKLSSISGHQDDCGEKEPEKWFGKEFEKESEKESGIDHEKDLNRDSDANSYLHSDSSSTTASNSPNESSINQSKPEGSHNEMTVSSEECKKDLESVARMIELMINGIEPDNRIQVRIGPSRKETLLEKVMNKAFAGDFESAQQMKDALEGKFSVARDPNFKGNRDVKGAKNVNRGFASVAGMAALKEQLRSEVIDVLSDREGAQKYGIDIPNGMLLYGPPGCGKTFIASKFAEESDYHFMYVKASDLASTYIHGTQEKIAQLFDQARTNAPTIICFDEFDAFVPCRDDVNNSSLRSEVNEFLTQMNNCGKDGIFVIATSNRPDKIDNAVLRAGRIDYRIYVPLPDKDARGEIFRIHITPRPHQQESIDYQKLADLTEGFVASDIASVVQQAARKAFKNKELITMDLLKSGIKECIPSLSKETLAKYERLRSQFEDQKKNSPRKPIGFF